MSVRLVEVVVADRHVPRVRDLLAPRSVRLWQESVPSGQEKFSSIVLAHEVEPLLRELDNAFKAGSEMSAVVIEVEALVPSEELAPPPPVDAPQRPPTALERFFSRDRRSTDEIYSDVADAVAINPQFLMTVVLSGIIAGLAMMNGQTAVVIGAMVIAPLLGPTLGLALAATVGDLSLGLRSARTLGAGALAAIVCTLPLGALMTFDPTAPELHNRAVVHLADIALALASGFAGVLALNRGASSSLVGVMIAVSLVPPLAAAGLYLGSGQPLLGLRALFLFANNLVCINIAGIAAFLLQGLPPRRWRMTAGVVSFWVALLVVFAAMMTGRIVTHIAWGG
ncbi:MAG: TIGR00341 family protein [Hyphomonadaceae bacterium]